MIDTGYEQVDLPFPAVNVKVNMEVANKTVTIYKGDQTPTEAEILNQLFDKTNTTTSYDDVKVDATLMATNITNTRRTEIKTPDVVVHVDPDRAELIEIQNIEGRKCLVIPMEGDVEINGIHVSTGNSDTASDNDPYASDTTDEF